MGDNRQRSGLWPECAGATGFGTPFAPLRDRRVGWPCRAHQKKPRRSGACRFLHKKIPIGRIHLHSGQFSGIDKAAGNVLDGDAAV